MENLDEVVLSHSVAPCQPRKLFAIPPSTLLFEDASLGRRTIYKLDCSVFPADSIPFIQTELNEIWDISFTKHEGKQLLFITEGHKGLFAYNYGTGDLEWSVKRKLHAGLTTDARGHLFHCVGSGEKRWVEVFTPEGTELGVLQIEKGEFLRPWRIRWCREISSLILAHRKSSQWFISIIAVKYPK